MASNTGEQDSKLLGKRCIDQITDKSNVNEPPRKKPKVCLESSPKLDENKCSVWIPKKRRQCKHDLISGTKYCRFHLPSDEATNIERIECTFCKTLIFKQNNLSKHYQRCPVKSKLDKIQKQPFYNENIHFYGDYNNEEKTPQNTMDSEQFILKLKHIYSSLTLTEVIDESKNGSFDAIRDLYINIHKDKQKLKHCIQIESIIYNIHKECDLNVDKPILLELGGGKASFGSMLHYFYKEESKLIIIDINCNFRHKEDNRLENVNNISRIECGLEHCNISLIKEIEWDKRRIFVISKHLCGAATDFGLRCILNDSMNINIIAIALCCRGKCSLETYCNIAYFESIGFQAIEFDLIRAMSSWEVDGNESDASHVDIGVMCRRLIDEGRVQFLRQNGFKNVRLIKYVDKNITKENILMLVS